MSLKSPRGQWVNTGIPILVRQHLYIEMAPGPISSPILKSKSLGILPPSHLTGFYYHTKWLGSQVTRQNPMRLWLMIWDILGRSKIIICILYTCILKFICVTFYGMFYNICTKGRQSAFCSLMNYVFNISGSNSIVRINLSVGCYGDAFRDVTIVLIAWHHNTVLTLMHGNVKQPIPRRTTGCLPK